jgi:Rrf2 family protein
VRVSAKADYAVRAMLALANSSEEQPVKGDRIATGQGIPLRFLENILGELRHQGLVASRRGSDGGYWLPRAADRITIAEIIRAVEGPLASVRGQRPDEISYEGEAAALQRVWMALRANVRSVLDSVTIADVVENRLPDEVVGLTRASETQAAD